jgi:hypothetical protein
MELTFRLVDSKILSSEAKGGFLLRTSTWIKVLDMQWRCAEGSGPRRPSSYDTFWRRDSKVAAGEVDDQVDGKWMVIRKGH